MVSTLPQPMLWIQGRNPCLPLYKSLKKDCLPRRSYLLMTERILETILNQNGVRMCPHVQWISSKCLFQFTRERIENKQHGSLIMKIYWALGVFAHFVRQVVQRSPCNTAILFQTKKNVEGNKEKTCRERSAGWLRGSRSKPANC